MTKRDQIRAVAHAEGWLDITEPHWSGRLLYLKFKRHRLLVEFVHPDGETIFTAWYGLGQPDRRLSGGLNLIIKHLKET